MGRLTNDKIVAKHRTELLAALESIRLRLKPSYMWDLTSENCHQIYTRLCMLKIASSPASSSSPSSSSSSLSPSFSSSSSSATVNPLSSCDFFSVIELQTLAYNNTDRNDNENNIGSSSDNNHNNNNNNNNNNPDNENDTIGTVSSLTFFGSIPQIVANINTILVELNDKSGVNANCTPSDVDSRFIDVSATLPAPRIVQHEEATMQRRKYILLRMRDYLRANIETKCLNASDCLRTVSSASSSSPLAIASDVGSDLCFLTGVFLGYPVIYCNTTPDRGNCLSHQPLCNYTLRIDRHTMYAFSVPHAFTERYRQRIEFWLEDIRRRTILPANRLRFEQSVAIYPLILT